MISGMTSKFFKNNGYKSLIRRVIFAVFFSWVWAPINLQAQIDLDSLINTIDIENDTIHALFEWVVTNHAYDVTILSDSYKIEKERLGYDTDVMLLESMIRNKKGVCHHYAVLFNALVKQVGYEAYVVSGYTYKNGRIADDSHAWNAVYCFGDWFIFDPTWAAGYVDENGVFSAELNMQWYGLQPIESVESHIPFDPIYQFLEKPMIFDGRGKMKSIDMTINFIDSIHHYQQPMDEDALKRTIARQRLLTFDNPLQKREIEYLLLKQKYLGYNSGIALIESAIGSFNEYISMKNKRFRNPSIKDEYIDILLRKAKQELDEGITRIEDLGRLGGPQDLEINRNLSLAREGRRRVVEEQEFLGRYLNTWKPLRVFIF